jgi:hypothetical protein
LGYLFESQRLAFRVSILPLPETQKSLGDLLGGATDTILEARINCWGHLLTEILGVQGALMVVIVFSLGILHEVGHLHLDGMVQILLDLWKLPRRAREEQKVQNMLVIELLLRVLPLDEVCDVLEDLVTAVLGNDLPEVGVNVVINLVFLKLWAHFLQALLKDPLHLMAILAEQFQSLVQVRETWAEPREDAI